MPVFEYRCKDCGNLFETLVRKKDQAIHCPGCSSASVVKQFSTFAYRGNSSSATSTSSSCSSCSAKSCATCH